MKRWGSIAYLNVNKTVDYSFRGLVVKLEEVKKFICNEFIYGHHWCSLNASAIVFSMMLLLGMAIRWEFLFIVYFGTQCIYNYNHYRELDVDAATPSPRVAHLHKYGTMYPSLIKLYGVLFFLLLFLYGNIASILFGSFLLSLGLIYTSNVKSMSKHIIGFKSLYTSISWGLLILFTMIYFSSPLTMAMFLFFLFVFLRMMIITTFYDIKDLQSDQEAGLLTLPMVFKHKSGWLNILHVLNVLSFTPVIVGVIFDILPLYSLFLLLILLYGFVYIQKAKGDTADINFLSYVIADGEYNIWPILLLLGAFIPFG